MKREFCIKHSDKKTAENSNLFCEDCLTNPPDVFSNKPRTRYKPDGRGGVIAENSFLHE